MIKPLSEAPAIDEVAKAEQELEMLYRELNRRMEGLGDKL